METTTVTDLYEATWLLINGCKLVEVECIKLGCPPGQEPKVPTRVSGKLACRLTFNGLAIPALQEEYFSKQAAINLFSFRQGYNQINGLVHQAKKNFTEREKELLRHAREAGGEA